MTDCYICHTLYHVLIALVRALRGRPALSCLVLSGTALPDAQALKARLEAAGKGTVWSDVLVVDEAALDRQNAQSELYRLRHPGRAQFALPRQRELNIYISNDWSALGRFLQREHIPYTLCEDTVGGTLDPDQHLLDAQRAAPDFDARRRGGGFAAWMNPAKGWLYWGDSRWCRRVESEDAARCTLFGAGKLVTFSKKLLLASLTAEEKAAVRAVFLTRPLPDAAAARGATLLLPRSFVADGLMTQAEQDAMFTAVAARYADGPLFIKAHPRDETDYEALFPDAVVLDRKMPSEVLGFCLPFRFRRAVTVQSWALRGFTAADETVFLTLDEAKGMIKR
ncbi:MAG: hypothetical protein ACI4OL_02150 [Gemmiger sp.]